MSDDNQTEAAPAAAPRKRRGGRLLFILIALFILGGGGGGAWWYLSRPQAEAAPKVEKEPTGLLPFEPFTVNLADPGGRKFLRVALLLVLLDEKTAKHVGENPLTVSRVRSAIIELLTTQTSAALATPEGRAELKKSIAQTTAQIAHVDVRDVLFKEFVVQ